MICSASTPWKSILIQCKASLILPLVTHHCWEVWEVYIYKKNGRHGNPLIWFKYQIIGASVSLDKKIEGFVYTPAVARGWSIPQIDFHSFWAHQFIALQKQPGEKQFIPPVMACMHAYNVISAQLISTDAFRQFDRHSKELLNEMFELQSLYSARCMNVCLD